MHQVHYIALEGPIGVGKSSLAKMLARDLKARLVLEEEKDNPFLSSFYEDPEKFAFQTQLFFLLSRYKQQIGLKQQDLFHAGTVCDYLFAKDSLFASLNLTEDELNLYGKVYDLLDSKLPKPDLVVYLKASPDVLFKHIKKRKAGYEQNISEDYIEKVSQAYGEFFFQYESTPLLVVDVSGLDFVGKPADYELFKRELDTMIKKGLKKHYVGIDNR